jgi:hypothetical protein
LKKRPFIKIADVLIIMLAAVLTGFSAFTAYLKPRNSVRVLIRGHDREWTLPLDAEEAVIVQGPLGNTIVRIHDNEAWVESSPCENQTCVAIGHVRRPGAWAVCLPNNVLLIIEGDDGREDDVDGAAW